MIIPRKTAARWARAAALVVFLIGLVVVVWPGVANLDLGDPYGVKTQTTVETVIAPDGSRTVTYIASPTKPSLIDQVLADGGLLILRLIVLIVAAFIAGAALQRILLGEFGSRAGGGP